jgi:hypothetical protein
MEKRCLDIGVRFCNDKADSYIDDLPAISSNLLMNLKGDELTSFKTFFSDIKDASFNRLLNDIEIEFSKGKGFNEIVSETKPFSIDRTHETLKTHMIHGYNVELPYHRFVDYNIEKIGIYALNAGTIELYIIDLIAGELIDKSKYTVHKGVNSIDINLVYQNEFQTNLFIGIHSDDVTFIKMKCDELTDCCECDYACECEIDYGMLNKCDIYEVGNIEPSDKFWCLQASVRCNFERMVCAYAYLFKQSYKYITAISILENKINSFERNWYTDANNELIKTETIPNLNYTYHQLLTIAVNKMKGITNDSICWTCEGGTNVRMDSLV